MKKWFLRKMASLSYRLNEQQRKNDLSLVRSLPGASIHQSIITGLGSKFEIHGLIKELKIDSGFSCRKYCNFFLLPNASLIIGPNVFFNNYCSVNCLDRIEIGANTLFGEGVKIYDHNHKYELTQELIIEHNEFTLGAIKIGKNCWIGSNVIILKGVTIGNNVIIGANCLIYKSIPDNSIVKHHESLVIESRKS